MSEELERAIARRRARRRRDECVVELARPDEDWWLSFATDGAAERAVESCSSTRRRRELPAIGRALVPLDEPFGGAARGARRERAAACD